MRDSYYDTRDEQWYPVDNLAKVATECAYCDEDLYEGDTAIMYDGMYFCCVACLFEYLDIRKVELTIEEGYFH